MIQIYESIKDSFEQFIDSKAFNAVDERDRDLMLRRINRALDYIELRIERRSSFNVTTRNPN